MNALDILKKLPEAFDPDAAAGAEGTVQLNLSTPVYVTVAEDVLTVTEGTAADPDVTLTAADDDLLAVLRGDLDGVTAFMSGKLQVDGDLMLAKDMPTFFDRAKLS